MPRKNGSTWLSVPELSQRLGVSEHSIYEQLRKDGEVLGVKAFRVGSRWVLPKAPLLKLESGDEGAA